LSAHEPPEDLRALRAELAQFRRVSNAVPVAIAYYEREGYVCRYANEGYAQMFGFDQQSILGRTVAEIIGHEAAQRIQPQVDHVIRALESVRYERQLPGADGLPRSIEVHLLPHVDQASSTIGAFVLIADITRHRRAEAALRDSEERLAKFMHASAEGIVFHKAGTITDVNPPLLQLLGYTIDEIVGRPALDFVAEDARPRVAQVMAAGEETRYDTAVVHRDGSRVPVEFIVRSMVVNGEHQRMTIVRDIRDRLEAQARIHHLAHHDALTGMPNRVAFIERAGELLQRAEADGRHLALLFLDLDHFKRVNDSLGHPAGDILLRTVAGRITSTLREADLVSRFGGDEFVLLLHGAASDTAVSEVATKLLTAVGAPLDVEGSSISVTPSIGVALFPAHGSSAAELIKHADTAMYRAKARGRAGFEFFHPQMAEAARAELAMESRLARAIREQEFVLHFQPQLRVTDGALMGVEALIRWAHPERGLVGPDEFIPLAEARRLILPIGQWVLSSALAQAVRWHQAGLARVPVAVNLSSLQFHAQGFLGSIERALAEAGATGSMLELEITERMLMDDIGEVHAVLTRLRSLGVRIAVDDFGTGYTSLQHLQRLPIDRLKIDRSFVEGLPGDAGSAAIAQAVIQLGRGLGLQVLAEGVATRAQRELLLAQGCEVQQGHLSGEPLPAGAFEDWLRTRLSASLPSSAAPSPAR
jgi:diguanylate cyclase (GGDEF)-like protein/PAS domain S-box-containing protein